MTLASGFNEINAWLKPVLFVRVVVSSDEMPLIPVLAQELRRFGSLARLLVIVDLQEIVQGTLACDSLHREIISADHLSMLRDVQPSAKKQIPAHKMRTSSIWRSKGKGAKLHSLDVDPLKLVSD